MNEQMQTIPARDSDEPMSFHVFRKPLPATNFPQNASRLEFLIWGGDARGPPYPSNSRFRSGLSRALVPGCLGCCGQRKVSAGNENERRAAIFVQAKGKRNFMPGSRPPTQSVPIFPQLEEDDGNPKFVIFIRTKNVPRWYPLSIISGGTTAKVMVQAMNNDWGKKLYEGSLTRNIAAVIYKDERTVRQSAVKAYPMLKAASGFGYGYKIVDPKNPRNALFTSNVVEIPPLEEMKSVVTKVKDFFGNAVDGVKDSLSGITKTEEYNAKNPDYKSKK